MIGDLLWVINSSMPRMDHPRLCVKNATENAIDPHKVLKKTIIAQFQQISNSA